MHGALGVGRHQHQTIACRMVCGIARGHRKGHAQIREAVLKDAAQLVIANLANEPALHAKPGKAGNRIGGRPAWAVGVHFDAGP